MTLVGVVSLIVLYVMALQLTPTERFQGLAQKIFYIHPPAAYAMQMAFIFTGIASLLYLLLHDARFDVFAEASAEVGMMFGVIVVMMVEIALISPPDGTVLYVLQGMRKDGGPITDVFSGVLPFMLVYILAVGVLMIFPSIATWLPTVMR